MDVTRHVDELERHGVALGVAARSAGLDAGVPSCPGWQVRDLVHHVSGVHRWARTFVATGRESPVPADGDADHFAPVDDTELLGRYAEGLDALVASLREAPEDLQCWSFLPAATPLAFWARRQCHETAVHSADAILAAGGSPSFDEALASDGLDELLCGFFSRPRSRIAKEVGLSLAVEAVDAARTWVLVVGEDGVTVADAGDAACRARGAASSLYLVLWNRAAPTTLEVEGDDEVLERWRTLATVTWS